VNGEAATRRRDLKRRRGLKIRGRVDVVQLCGLEDRVHSRRDLVPRLDFEA